MLKEKYTTKSKIFLKADGAADSDLLKINVSNLTLLEIAELCSRLKSSGVKIVAKDIRRSNASC